MRTWVIDMMLMVFVAACCVLGAQAFGGLLGLVSVVDGYQAQGSLLAHMQF